MKNNAGTVEKRCIICDSAFKSFKSDKRKFCSRTCYHKSPESLVRKKNRIIKNCAYCNTEFERAAGNFKSYVINHFCCHECSSKWWSENGLHGRDHPNWMGGYTQKAYNDNWTAIKKAIKERANGVCEICSKTHKCMDVHHLIPVRLGVDISIINHFDNLQYLCRPCHVEADKDLRGRYPHQKATAA